MIKLVKYYLPFKNNGLLGCFAFVNMFHVLSISPYHHHHYHGVIPNRIWRVPL